MISDKEISEELCGLLWPYIQDENITDIIWDGTALWFNDLKKGHYRAVNDKNDPIILSKEYLEIFCGRIANINNVTFNFSNPVLEADTSTLRIQAEHYSVSGDGLITLAIRKTPAIARLTQQDVIKTGYMDRFTQALIPCLIRSHQSGIIIGDVGAGKTELQKYMVQYIPNNEGIRTIEDTLELKLKTLYPEKRISSYKIDNKVYTTETAIRGALRGMTKWLVIAESRGREISRIMEGASTGCKTLTTIHAENVWEIPDRINNMSGDEKSKTLVNDVFSYFGYAIKVVARYTENGIERHIDQIAFFNREGGQNEIIKFMVDGKLTGERMPKKILDAIKLTEKESKTNKELAGKYETDFLKLYDEQIEGVDING